MGSDSLYYLWANNLARSLLAFHWHVSGNVPVGRGRQRIYHCPLQPGTDAGYGRRLGLSRGETHRAIVAPVVETVHSEVEGK